MRLAVSIIVVGLLGTGLVTAQSQPRGPGGAPNRGEHRGPGMQNRPMSAEEIEERLSKLPPERAQYLRDRAAELASLPESERRARFQELRQRFMPELPEAARARFLQNMEQWHIHRVRLRVAQKVALRLLDKNPELRGELAALPRVERIDRLRDLIQREMRAVIRNIYMPDEFRERVGPGKQLPKEDLERLLAGIESARRLAVTNAIEAYPDVDARAKLRTMATDPEFIERTVRDFGFIDVDLGPKAQPEHRERRYRMYFDHLLKRGKGNKPPKADSPDGRPPRPDGREGREGGPEGRPFGPDGRRPNGENRPVPPEGGFRPRRPGEGGAPPEGRGPREGRPENRPERPAPDKPTEPAVPEEPAKSTE